MKIFNLTDNQRKVNEHKTHLSDWQRLNMFRKKKKPSNIMRVYVDDVISYAVSGSVNWHKPLRV